METNSREKSNGNSSNGKRNAIEAASTEATNSSINRVTTQKQKQQTHFDSFMASMTFASSSQDLRQCDCDECGLIPMAILEAIRKQKRIRIETGPLKRTQDRNLIKRDPLLGISIWNLVMPVDAEPLIEFGSSHRLIYVKSLPGILKSIGTGIVGSSDEENSRKVLNWKEGNIYLVPSNGGKAVGWFHTSSSDSNDAEEGQASEDVTESSAADEQQPSNNDKSKSNEPFSIEGHAVLNVIKIPMGSLEASSSAEDENRTANTTNDEEPTWGELVLSVCSKALSDVQDQTETTAVTLSLFAALSESESSKLKAAIQKLA